MSPLVASRVQQANTDHGLTINVTWWVDYQLFSNTGGEKHVWGGRNLAVSMPRAGLTKTNGALCCYRTRCMCSHMFTCLLTGAL